MRQHTGKKVRKQDTNLGSVNPNSVFVHIEDTKNKWTDINVFYSIIVTTEFEVRIQTAQGMLDVVSHSEVLIKKSVELV